MLWASIYGTPQNTASGEWFTGKDLTVAMLDTTVPYGTWVLIEYHGLTITARKTDYGPFIPPRKIDLSKHVAKMLKFPGRGKVCVTILR
jgi:rare lipoprotein A